MLVCILTINSVCIILCVKHGCGYIMSLFTMIRDIFSDSVRCAACAFISIWMFSQIFKDSGSQRSRFYHT